jgi:hypothetical protein
MTKSIHHRDKVVAAAQDFRVVIKEKIAAPPADKPKLAGKLHRATQTLCSRVDDLNQVEGARP